jgi:hypothetical protein
VARDERAVGGRVAAAHGVEHPSRVVQAARAEVRAHDGVRGAGVGARLGRVRRAGVGMGGRRGSMRRRRREGEEGRGRGGDGERRRQGMRWRRPFISLPAASSAVEASLRPVSFMDNFVYFFFFLR